MFCAYTAPWLFRSSALPPTFVHLSVEKDVSIRVSPPIFSAVTSREVDEAGLNRLGERNVNMQRAVLLRQGWDGRNDDQLMDYYFTQPLKKGELFCDPECIVPGKNGEITSVEGRMFDRQDFENLKDEYYELRGWDVETGLLKASTLKEFDLEDIAEDLAERGLLK